MATEGWEEVTEKEVLQSAADEARKAARAAREAASILDDYAKYLVQPAYSVKTTAMHATATSKLKAANDALAVSNKLMKEHADDAAAKKDGRK
jgi:hypothetical protein